MQVYNYVTYKVEHVVLGWDSGAVRVYVTSNSSSHTENVVPRPSTPFNCYQPISKRHTITHTHTHTHTDDQFARALALAVQMGFPVLVEGVGETLDSILTPLLLRQTFKQGSRNMVVLGSETLEWSDNFRLYITTKMQNPHYTPETSTKVRTRTNTRTRTHISNKLAFIPRVFTHAALVNS
jgi:hypothetical protein